MRRRPSIAEMRARITGLGRARQQLGGGGEYRKADTLYPLLAFIDLEDDVPEAIRAAAPRENAPPFVPARQYQLR